MGGRRATDEGGEEARESDRARLFPFELENLRVEFRARKKSQDDGAKTGEELDPGLVGPQHRRPNRRADNQLRDRSDHNLGQSRRNTQPNREQRRDQGKAHPKRRKGPDPRHDRPRRFGSLMPTRPSSSRANAAVTEPPCSTGEYPC